MEIAYSVNGVAIRLAEERWNDMVENHDDLAGRMEDVINVVESPDWITRGQRGSLLAWKAIRRRRVRRHGILHEQGEEEAQGMAQVKQLNERDFSGLLRVVPQLVKFPVKRLWLDYDEEADVLYVSFRRPQKATNTQVRDDGILVRKRGKQIAGLTILDASCR